MKHCLKRTKATWHYRDFILKGSETFVGGFDRLGSIRDHFYIFEGDATNGMRYAELGWLSGSVMGHHESSIALIVLQPSSMTRVLSV